jgi:hypothetical protein
MRKANFESHDFDICLHGQPHDDSAKKISKR